MARNEGIVTMIKSEYRSIVLHLGFPKCASTYLQKEFFPSVCGQRFLGKRSWIYDETKGGLSLSQFLTEPVESLPISLLAFLDEMDQRKSSGPLVFSDEHFLNKYVPRMSNVGGNFQGLTEDFQTVISAFMRAGWTVSVLVIFRRQPEWLMSRFSEDSKSQLVVSQGRLCCFLDDVLEAVEINPTQSVINFLSVYSFMCQSVGKNNVLFVPLEELASEHDKSSWTEIAQFVGVSRKAWSPTSKSAANRGRRFDLSWKPKGYVPKFLSGTTVLGKAIRRSRIYPHLKSLFGRRIRSIFLPVESERRVLELFRHSNMQLSRMLRRDLGKYGYFKS